MFIYMWVPFLQVLLKYSIWFYSIRINRFHSMDFEFILHSKKKNFFSLVRWMNIIGEIIKTKRIILIFSLFFQTTAEELAYIHQFSIHQLKKSSSREHFKPIWVGTSISIFVCPLDGPRKHCFPTDPFNLVPSKSFQSFLLFSYFFDVGNSVPFRIFRHIRIK